MHRSIMLSLSGRFSTRQLQRFVSCWSCSASSQEVICSKCGKVQPAPKEINYFKVLGQDEKFTVKPQQLQQKFREMQWVLHPDKFANSSEVEKTYSADQSALVNRAYQVLLKPIQRATYLLKLKGVSLDDVQLPQEFLFEMMELNEEIDEADSTKKKELLERIEEFQEKAMATLQEQFVSNKIKEASETLARTKYFENLKNRLS